MRGFDTVICLVQDGKEIARLVFGDYGWWTAYTVGWGQCTSSLESHLLHLGNYFPLATFVFVG
jgi:hypothetical protein